MFDSLFFHNFFFHLLFLCVSVAWILLLFLVVSYLVLLLCYVLLCYQYYEALQMNIIYTVMSIYYTMHWWKMTVNLWMIRSARHQNLFEMKKREEKKNSFQVFLVQHRLFYSNKKFWRMQLLVYIFCNYFIFLWKYIILHINNLLTLSLSDVWLLQISCDTKKFFDARWMWNVCEWILVGVSFFFSNKQKMCLNCHLNEF